MTDLSMVTQWYITANILLIAIWCLFALVILIVRSFRVNPTHKSLLLTTRYLFVLMLIIPAIGQIYSQQNSLEALLPVNESVSTYTADLFRTLDSFSEPIIDIEARRDQSIFSETSILSFVVLALWIAIAGRMFLVTRSLRALSRLIKGGYQWKKSGKLRIIFSDFITIPFSTLALGRFHIVMPTSLLTRPADLRVAIKHEGTHHRHGDTAWLLLLEVMKLLFCLNPFIFIWARSFEALQENACDEALINRNHVSLNSYCNCLIGLSQSIADFNPSLIAVSSILKRPAIFMFPNNRLIRRIKMMSQQKKIRFSTFKSVGLAAPILLMALSLTFLIKANLFADGSGVSDSPVPAEQILAGKTELNSTKSANQQVIPSILPASGKFSSAFGDRNDPFTGIMKFHKGIDISNKTGTPIIAPLDGIVSFAERRSSFGLLLVIVHDGNVITRYGQVSKILVKVGSKVSKGQTVALMGMSGRSTGPHLHYELIVDQQHVDPIPYVEDPHKYLKN